MGVFIYTLALIFFIIPVSLRAYLSLKNGRFPLPYFQNNVVVNRIKLRKAIGIVSPILFWGLHVFLVFWTIAIEAWMSALAILMYMVISPLLSGQIKARQVTVAQEKVVPSLPGGDQS
ncbi:hypothetical protein [Pseudoxanthomonas sp. Root630]|uniref:hypothetical protein n=1 Tax=Pseudoxanthomonas sp. Root630 TaxID=1736574 RepID=UPI0007026CE4|nr:hypothetical protein [Pseudoxanthomonas sp. Root630]KRA46470.1 hypothetical protein ASD72_04505 [Pseudoxanthomonas sp. Root630]